MTYSFPVAVPYTKPDNTRGMLGVIKEQLYCAGNARPHKKPAPWDQSTTGTTKRISPNSHTKLPGEGSGEVFNYEKHDRAIKRALGSGLLHTGELPSIDPHLSLYLHHQMWCSLPRQNELYHPWTKRISSSRPGSLPWAPSDQPKKPASRTAETFGQILACHPACGTEQSGLSLTLGWAGKTGACTIWAVVSTTKLNNTMYHMVSVMSPETINVVNRTANWQIYLASSFSSRWNCQSRTWCWAVWDLTISRIGRWLKRVL